MDKCEFPQYIHIDPLILGVCSIYNWTNLSFVSTHIQIKPPLLLGDCSFYMDPPNYLKLFLLLALCICVDSVDEKDSTKHDEFDELTGSESYDKRIIPQGKDGESLTVGATLYVLRIVDMTETG